MGGKIQDTKHNTCGSFLLQLFAVSEISDDTAQLYSLRGDHSQASTAQHLKVQMWKHYRPCVLDKGCKRWALVRQAQAT